MIQVVVAVCLALFAAPVFADDQPSLTLSFEPDGIAVAGATPKASVYVFGQARELAHGFVNVVARQTTLQDDDSDGRAAWEIGGPVPARSVWLAVDLQTGAYGTAAPADYPATRITLTGDHLKKRFGSEIEQLAFEGMLLDYIVVRPGVGAWRGSAALRGADDEGTDEKKPTLSVEKLQPEPGTAEAAPKHLRKGDVVFIINSVRAEYAVTRIGEEK